MNGIIDDVMLWDRALTQDEVAALGSGAQPTAVEAIDKLSTMWGAIKSATK